MTITHNFVNSNSIGGVGEAIFLTLLSELGDVRVVTKDREWQKKGIDFILDGVTYDTKLDTKAKQTGNIALETVSRRKGDEVIKFGWVYTSEADYIVYIFLNGMEWELLFLSQDAIAEYLTMGYPTKTVKNYGYESTVVLVPLKDIPDGMRIPVTGAADLTELRRIHEERVAAAS